MKNTIEIEGMAYPIKFGYGAIRTLGIYLDTPGYDTTILKVNEILQKLTAAEKEGTGIPFEVTDALGYLLLSGLENAGAEIEVEATDLSDFVLMNPEKLPAVFELFMESMPKPPHAEKKKSHGP